MITKKFLILFILISLLVLVSCQSTKKETEQTANLSPENRLEQIKTELKEVKAALTKEGEYNCCIQPTCNWCVLHDADCECYDHLKSGKDVCPECGLGWHNGKGVVEGVTASQVKWSIIHEHESAEHEN